MEPQCTPSRSVMLTGRLAFRSGTQIVPEFFFGAYI
jgi:arylsulfatase A-like enzyme